MNLESERSKKEVKFHVMVDWLTIRVAR